MTREAAPSRGASLAAVSGPAYGSIQSVEETGKDSVTDLHVFANGGSVECGGNPDQARVGEPSWRRKLPDLKPEDGGVLGVGGDTVGWLAQRQQ